MMISYQDYMKMIECVLASCQVDPTLIEARQYSAFVLETAALILIDSTRCLKKLNEMKSYEKN